MFFRIVLLLFCFNVYVLADILPSCDDARIQKELKQQLKKSYIAKVQKYIAKDLKSKQNRGDFSNRDQNFYNSFSEGILQEMENKFDTQVYFDDFFVIQDFGGMRYCRARMYDSDSTYENFGIEAENFGIEGIYSVMQADDALLVVIITGFGRDVEIP